MDDEMKNNLKEFFKRCYSRLEIGERKGGDRFESLDLFEEITDELADISNYAFLQYIKLLKLKEKMKAIRDNGE
jgi:NTP pyrophosphatase (non-canonical NTP hydrolase)